MLIRFNVENFLSFKDRTVFSMIPGKGTLKKTHKSKPVKGISALKTSIVYGANASGKSNLLKAIAWGKRLILKGTKSDQPIRFQNFMLDTSAIQSNSRIEYEFQNKGKNYAYGFVFNSKEIVEEWLYELNKKNENKIFERNISKKEIFDLEPILKKNKKDEHKQFIKFVAKGTPNNQLFLTEINTRKVKENVTDISDLLNTLDWFQNSLKVIFPSDKYNEGVKYELQEDSKLQMTFEELLKYFDTGIDGICLENTDFEKSEIPKILFEKIKEEILNPKSKDVKTVIVSSNKNTTYFVTKKNEDIIIQQFMAKHHVKGQKKSTFFDMSNESDGTNRIIDFIPLIIDLLNGNNVFLIDEMERSLHPNLMYDLIDVFLSKCENVNSQLIVGSHESTLLTQKLFRKDEIWFIVKDQDGASHLHSLEEYNVRFDKEIRKDYLLGRFKGVPRLGNRNKLTVLPK